MGLDLMLYRVPKEIKGTPNFSYWNADNDDEELAYGRKTWGIYSFFRIRCKEVDNEVYLVTAEDWQDFMDYFEDWDMPRIMQIIDNVWRLGSKYDWSAADADYIVEFVDGMGEGQLGYEWDAQAMLNWRDADKKVRDAFANGDEVVMLASY